MHIHVFDSVVMQFINKSGHFKRNAFKISKPESFPANNPIISISLCIGQHFYFINHYKEAGQKQNILRNKWP